MINFLFSFVRFFLCFSAAAGVIFALVCFLDWLFGLVKKHVKEKDDA